MEKTTSGAGEKLGTYGVIKGAVNFIGASVAEGELALEALTSPVNLKNRPFPIFKPRTTFTISFPGS